jgi:hypothetical protein
MLLPFHALARSWGIVPVDRRSVPMLVRLRDRCSAVLTAARATDHAWL